MDELIEALRATRDPQALADELARIGEARAALSADEAALSAQSTVLSERLMAIEAAEASIATRQRALARSETAHTRAIAKLAEDQAWIDELLASIRAAIQSRKGGDGAASIRV